MIYHLNHQKHPGMTKLISDRLQSKENKLKKEIYCIKKSQSPYSNPQCIYTEQQSCKIYEVKTETINKSIITIGDFNTPSHRVCNKHLLSTPSNNEIKYIFLKVLMSQDRPYPGPYTKPTNLKY